VHPTLVLQQRGKRLRDVEFYATSQSDKNLAISVLSQFEFAPSCTLLFQNVALNHPIDFSNQSSGMSGDSSPTVSVSKIWLRNNFCAGTHFRDVSLSDSVALQQQADT
jgi:hypothetical protein